MRILILTCLCFMNNCFSAKAQVFTCYSDGLCGIDGGVETGRDDDEVACCQHGVAPFGLSYTIEGLEVCNICPIEFGFVNPSFTAQESTDSYLVGLAFFSGQSALGGFFLTLELVPVTADQTMDIGVTFNRVFFPDLSGSNDIEIRYAEVQFRPDSIAQESNEIFRLTFPPDPDILPGANLRNSFEGVIVDATRVTFEMTEESYREREGDTGFMPIVITKNNEIFLSNPVTFLVIPWTVQQAEAEGLIPSVIVVPDGTLFSPNRADANDFNISRIVAEFEADEGRNAIADLDVPIPVFDDSVDEANDQYFIAEFRVAAAFNISLISLQQRASRCRIVDNDPVLHIGFQLNQYDFFEPESGNAVISNVTVIKENNVVSEQTYGITITFSDPDGGAVNAATLQPVGSQGAFDYVVSSPGDTGLLLFILPQDSEATFLFTIFADDLVEGTEGFRASLSSEGDPFPNFALPRETDPAPYPETLIRILDTDSSEDVHISFETSSYTFSESDRAGIIRVRKTGISPGPIRIRVSGGPSTQSNVVVSAEGLRDREVEFSAGGSITEFISISIAITDDNAEQEAIEMYTASLEIISSIGIVQIGSFSMTSITILNDDVSIPREISCFRSPSCTSGNFTGTATVNDCCQHGVRPFGLAYAVPGQEQQCFPCPVEFGFVHKTFIAKESTDFYDVEVAFFSGSAVGEFLLPLQFIAGTANEHSDVGFIFSRVLIPPVVEQNELQILSVPILFRQDLVSQEENETFTLTFTTTSGELGSNPTLRGTFSGVVIDSTPISFQFSEDRYREREGDTGFMPVIITKDSEVFLANSVSFVVIPWTVQQAEAEGLIPSVIVVPDDTPFSPNRADANDFNISRIIAVFEADEGRNTIADLDVPIPVFDDSVDEANDQYFIAEFRVVAALNMSLISLQQRASRCRIVDNDPILRIGFQLNQYDFFEPESGNVVISNVTVIKENNVVSEQTYGIAITFSDPGRGALSAATLQPVGSQGAFDYVVSSPGDNTELLLFNPQDSEATLSFTIFADDLVEGTEGFRASLSSVRDPFPNFALPRETDPSSYPETLIRILDTDFALLGFERPSYTVNEDGRIVEVCVILRNPPVAFNIILDVVPTPVTADNSDFFDRRGVAFFARGSTSSRSCTRFLIRQDNFIEITESFNVTLHLQGGVPSVVVDSPVTQVFILDSTRVSATSFVEFRPTNYQVTEGEIVEFIMILSESSVEEVTVDVATVGITADSGDYSEVANMAVTFPAGTVRASFEVVTLLDSIFEGPETFNVIILSARRVAIGLNHEATATIVDVVSIGFINTPYRQREDNGPAVVTVEARGDLQQEIEVRIITEPSEATPETDYSSVNTTITFSETVNVISVNIPLIDDVLVEGDETLNVRIAILTVGNTQLFTPQTELVTILDDDRVVIGLDETMVSVTEDVGRRELCASIILGMIMRDVLVNVVYEDRNARDGEDFNSDPRVLTFSPGMDSVCFTVSIVDDDRYELDEDFFVNITTTDPQAEVNPMTTLVSIVDDEILIIGWEFPEYSVAEADTEVEICAVVKSQTTQATILPRINILLADGTATASGDYNETPNPRFFDFQPGTPTRMCTRISITMDVILESPERFFSELADSLTQRVVYDTQRTAVVIFDSNDATIGFRPDSYTVSEGTGFADLVVEVLNGILATDVVVRLTISDGNTTSMAPVDYHNPGEVLLTFSSSVSSISTRVMIEDDQIAEYPEVFFSSLERVTDINGVTVAPNEASVTINDNDDVRIGFEEILYEVDESGPSGRVNVAIIAFGDNLQREVEVVFSTRDSSATSTDYGSLIAPVQFDELQRRVVLSINIDDDDILENTENFFGHLTTSNDFVNLDPAETEIRIFDLGDDVTIGFRPNSYSVNETDGSVTLNVEVLDGMLERSVTVLFFTESGSATQEEPEDYSLISRVLTFDADMLSQRVPVTIINDDRVEGTETFFAILDSQGQPVITSPGVASVAILEDAIDRVTIGFERTSYLTTEGTILEVCARILDGDIERDVAVRVSSAEGTASAGASDYESVDLPLIFTSTLDRKCFNVTVNDDATFEIEERFNLELDIDDSIAVLNPDEAEVIITDTDDVVVALEQTDFTATEVDGASIEVCAVIASETTLDRDAVVTLQSADRTATSSGEMDFVAVNSDLTFSPGFRRSCRNILIINDAFYENAEIFEVFLSTTDPSVSIDPTRQTGEATIEDDDAITIGFVRETDSVAEDLRGSIDLCVIVLSGMLEISATVTVATANAGEGIGFPAAGVDYVPSSREITFTNANRDIPQCLNVPIIDDVLVEGVELFFGLLSNTNSIPRLTLDPQRTIITIADTDMISIGFINTPYRQHEGNSPAVITLEARGELQQEIEVMVSSESLSEANSETDYTSVAAIITFNETVSVINVSIPLIDDDFVEGDETLTARIVILTIANVHLSTPETEVVTILDDDRVVIGLDETMVFVTEDFVMRELCASITTGIIMRDVLINVVYEDRSARDGVDYRSDPRVLTFSPGVDSVCFNVSIIDDTLYELDEDFFVNITTTDPQAEIYPMTALVSIVNDDILIIGWEFTEYSVAEADSEVEICAVVKSQTTQAIFLPRINILLADGTATASDDYGNRPDPRFFNFQPGNPTRMCTRISITADGILEATESFFADLASILLPITQRVVYDIQRTTIVISDSDATVTFRPNHGNQLGGTPVIIRGLPLQPTDFVRCIFDGIAVLGAYVDPSSALCVTPIMNTQGIVDANVTIFRGLSRETFSTKYTNLSPARAYSVEFSTVSSSSDANLYFNVGDRVQLTWLPEELLPRDLVTTSTSTAVDISLFQFRDRPRLGNLRSSWIQIHEILNVSNTGSFDFEIPHDVGLENCLGQNEACPISFRVSAIFGARVVISGDVEVDLPEETFSGIWSGAAFLQASQATSISLSNICGQWGQPSNRILGSRLRQLPACPRTLRQAVRDARFQLETSRSIVTSLETQYDEHSRRFYTPMASTCYVQTVMEGSASAVGHQCCYDVEGRLVTGQGGGSIDKVSPLTSFTDHMMEDLLPYAFCCHGGLRCDLYEEFRPSRLTDEPEFVLPIPACVYGDPHLVTLDGHRYTFNGKGEFTLVETHDNIITVQGRMEQAMDSSGNTAPGTVFTSIVAHQAGDVERTVEFQVSLQGGLDILVDGEIVDFTNLQEQSFQKVVVTKDGSSSGVADFSEGANIRVEVENGIISVMLITLSERYNSLTSGLMGNFNGDETDDFISRGSTASMPVDSSAEEIFSFGNTWVITESESLFAYNRPGESFASFLDSDFTPAFEPEFDDPELQQRADEICGGNQACLFDVAATKNEEIGMATMMGIMDFEIIVETAKPIVCDPPCDQGVCVATNNCSCAMGYSGARCTQRVERDCDSNLCQNGGTCVQHARSTTCSCPEGFIGIFCQEEEPPLSLRLINSSPRINGRRIAIDFIPSQPLSSARCILINHTEIDCSSGRARFSDLSPGSYILNIEAETAVGETAVETRTIFVCAAESGSCGVNLINEGVTVSGDCARLQFTGCFFCNSYACRLDGGNFVPCRSPLQYCGLQPGLHSFQVVPTDPDCTESERLTRSFTIL